MSLFKKAETKASRLKAFVYGATGTGKTITAISFPDPVVIDMEKGTDLYGKYTDFYVLRSRDPKTVLQSIDELLNDPQDFKTVVLDSVTILYEAVVLSVENRLKKKHGNPSYVLIPSDYKMVRSEMKNILHRIFSLDMNVIVTARAKKMYAPGEFMKEVGIIYDCPEYIPFDFDVVLELSKNDDGTFHARVIKDRTNTLGLEFPYSYEAFVEKMGIDGLERDPIVFNQQQNLADMSPRPVEIVFNGDKMNTAGVTAEQLTTISELVEEGDEVVIETLLHDKYFADSFLDLKEDEAKSFIEEIQKDSTES